MAETKIVIGNTDGKTYQKVLESTEPLIGRSLGETLKGDVIGFSGYEFLITGGSDHCGFPMRKDVKGSRRARILAHSGVGVNIKEKGKLVRKTVVGNAIGEKTIQINLKVTKSGNKKLDELFGNKEETPEAKQEEKPKEEVKETKEAPKAKEKPKENKEGETSDKKD